MDRNSVLGCVHLIPVLDAYNTNSFHGQPVQLTVEKNLVVVLNLAVFLVCYSKLCILFYKLALSLLAPELNSSNVLQKISIYIGGCIRAGTFIGQLAL